MFCYQCQETAFGKGCERVGVCGKQEDLANSMDVLVLLLKGLAAYDAALRKKGSEPPVECGRLITEGLFTTITNANFDKESIWRYSKRVMALRNQLKEKLGRALPQGWTNIAPATEQELQYLPEASVEAIQDEDSRSLRQMVTYGLKGASAYAEHAARLGYEDNDLYAFIAEALAATMDESLSLSKLTQLVLDTGEHGVKAMALLDRANTESYGHPEITKVNIGVRGNPGILISGHDLRDIEHLLQQTEGTGVDVYTHSEMLPAHYYPKLKKYKHLAGNYGNAWHKQLTEFETFNGPILFTSNCIVPARSNTTYMHRVFTTNAARYEGAKHIEADALGRKDFSDIIDMAKKCPPPQAIEEGEIIGGFAHNQTIALADKVIDAVKSGAIKKFFVMGGCDGRMANRSYYTEFAEKLPKDTVILTAGCAKYRYNKLQLGDIGGIPRVLDAGQCNDSYSLVLIALKLKEAFGLDDINKLPIVFNIAWYEQKAVIVLLALLYLGVKNIHLGPTLPGFLSPKTAKLLTQQFGLAGIGQAEADVKAFMA